MDEVAMGRGCTGVYVAILDLRNDVQGHSVHDQDFLCTNAIDETR